MKLVKISYKPKSNQDLARSVNTTLKLVKISNNNQLAFLLSSRRNQQQKSNTDATYGLRHAANVRHQLADGLEHT